MRKLSQATGIPKSSVERHCQALRNRTDAGQADFWEQETGHEWLRQLVVATIFVFGLKAGVGADRVSEFFHRLQIHRHVGCSATALRGLRDELERLTVRSGTEQHAQLQHAGQPIDICAGVDETFFDQVMLVLMDLDSGYIVLEEAAQDRTYATWQARAQQALKKVGLGLRYVVSDRAQALVKLALTGFGCASIPDSFHVLRDLAKATSLGLALKITRVDEKRGQAQQRLSVLETQGKETHVQRRLVAHWDAQAATLRTDQTNAQALLRQASQAIHPFALADSHRQSAAQVATALHQTVAALNTLRAHHTLRDNTQAVAKFTRQIAPLASLIDLWWQGVEQNVVSSAPDAETRDWLCEQLLPTLYWQRQIERTKTPALKDAYRQAFKQAEQRLRQHSVTTTLSPPALERWEQWALDQVALFQRASSAVEGRNGYLSQLNHCARGTSTQRLKVLTVIHNFDLKRADGTTAAERLFGQTFPDVFEWTLARMGELPLPRKTRATSKPKSLFLQSVPP